MGGIPAWHACRLLLAVLLTASAAAQSLSQRPATPAAPAAAPQQPNSDPTYQRLRHVAMSGESVSVSNLVLQRDAGTFTFRSGVFTFLAPIDGKVTGAVFVGDGSFALAPPLESEKRTLALLTRAPVMEEQFGELVLRFSDATYDEIKRAGSASSSPAAGASGLVDDVNSSLRKELHYNLHARLLEDVLGTGPGGLFWAFIKGKKYSKKMVYAIDPHGLSVFGVAPEEVALMTYDVNNYKAGIWCAFHFSSEYAAGQATGDQQDELVDIDHQKLETVIERNARLSGTAVTTFQAVAGGVRVAMFDLFPTLRVQSVSDGSGQPLAFIQENKDDDPDFAVILPRALAAGESFTMKTVYAGKDAISNEGGDNYYPIAREDWYPNTSFGDYETYEMTFRIPKGMTMVAAGAPLRNYNEGGENISEWKSESAQPAAGFNFGKFRRDSAKVEKAQYEVESYANEDEPDIVSSLRIMNENLNSAGPVRSGELAAGVPLGTMSTTGMMKKALGEAQLAVQIYSEYFGPSLFHHLAMTQQTAFNYGQSWPNLVYLPITSFFDSTTRHALGMDDPTGYFKVVGPHEVAHQWWGHTVGFNSYRDQWMSEGFAEFSASLFLQNVYGPEEYQKFWEDERKLLTDKSREGYRAIDVGPLTQGYRLANSRSGFDIPRRLIYPKGGYILHMLRMMMWSPQGGDLRFKEMMHDFVKTYSGHTATTEEFQSIVEKHMTPQMDLDGDHKMNWFFRPFVYGTTLPTYNLQYSFDDGPGGLVLNFKITQSNVEPGFKMLVPLYLQLANGKMARLGAATLVGNSSVEQKVPLNSLKEKPKGAVLNYFHDVLCLQSN